MARCIFPETCGGTRLTLAAINVLLVVNRKNSEREGKPTDVVQLLTELDTLSFTLYMANLSDITPTTLSNISLLT
jgi:hypothetical protein